MDFGGATLCAVADGAGQSSISSRSLDIQMLPGVLFSSGARQEFCLTQERSCCVNPGCDDKEKGFIAKWKDKPSDDVSAQAERLYVRRQSPAQLDLREWR